MNVKLFFLLFGLISMSLFGEIQDYLKPVKNKSDIHKMRNIDFIYMINLDQRPEKFANCLMQLKPYDIRPYRFSAVNGWELSLQAIQNLGVKFEPWMKQGIWGTSFEQNDEGKIVGKHEVMHVPGKVYFGHCLSRGAIGIVLSHLSILYNAYVSRYKTIWVMEDDIQVIQDPNILSDLIDKLDQTVGKEGWDILFTDQDTKNRHGHYIPCLGYAPRPDFTPENPERFAIRENIGKEFRKIGARYGAYSMIVRRSGMRKILNFFKKYKIFCPYDMEFVFPADIKVYTVINDVVSTQIDAISDNGSPNYNKKPKQPKQLKILKNNIN